MKSFILFCVINIYLGCSTVTGASHSSSSFAVSDSSGNRYGGVYKMKDGKVSGSTFGTKDGRKIDHNFGSHEAIDVNGNKDDFPDFVPLHSFHDVDKYVPDYFKDFGEYIPQPYYYNFANPMYGYEAAMRNFGFPVYQPGYIPNFDFRLNGANGLGGLPGFSGLSNLPGFNIPNLSNSAIASASAFPGFSHQIAAISPSNPNQGNIDVVHSFSEPESKSPNFVSVQSSSFSSSSNINGKPTSHRGATTTVNNNGKITSYKVES